MRVFTAIIGLALCLHFAPAARSELPTAGSEVKKDRTGGDFVVGVSPFLDASVKDAVYRGLVRLIVEDLPLNSRLEVFDAYDLQSVAQVAVPNAAVFNSPKTRANQFASAIGQIRQFLARDNPKPQNSKLSFNSAIRLPQFCDFLSQNRPLPKAGAKVPLLLIGSPLYQDAKEPAFSMVDGYFPSDGHLHASRTESVFGLNPGESSEQPLLASWAWFGDPWMSDLHREKVERFWALYLERRGGSLASFSGDLATALSAFGSQNPGASAASKGWVTDPLQTKAEMIRVNRTVQQVDWLNGDLSGQPTPPPPSRLVGPMKIGIRWKENIDLDLYATPRPDAEVLFFQHMRSPEGYYFKDHRSSPGREYEYIEFEAPVDVREAKAFVNFYAGDCDGGPGGEIRIEFLDRVYRGNFSIDSPHGNKGRSGPSQARFWTQIPIQEILGLNDPARRADSR